MSKSKQKNNRSVHGKARIAIAVTLIALVTGATGLVWYLHHKRTEEVGVVSLPDGPSIASLPGVGNPSDRYVSEQNKQNSQLATAARKAGTSDVPTITRPSFVGDPNAFVDAANARDKKVQSKQCAINAHGGHYYPDPENCTVDSLKRARLAGVSAEELACQNCPLSALEKAGYTAGALKRLGFTAAQLKAAGYTLKQLEQAGFSPAALKKAGFTASELARSGLSAGQLLAAGFTPDEIQKAGLSTKGLLTSDKAGSLSGLDKLAALKKAGYSANDLLAAGYTPDQLAKAGFDQKAIRAALAAAKKCSVSSLKTARLKGVSAASLKKMGCGLAALKAAGYTAAQLRDAGFSASALKAAGFSAKALRDAGFSAADLKKAGFSAKALKAAGYSDGDLIAAGYPLSELKAAGVSAKALRDAGFSAAALRKAGYSAADLKAAGYSAAELKKAGFNAGQLAAAGFSPEALRKAGFTASQLRAAGFSAGQLKKAGFTAAALKQAGYSDGDLMRAGFVPAVKASKASTTTALPASSNTTISPKDNGVSKLAAFVRAGDSATGAMGRDDQVQQLQGAMQMQASRMASEWTSVSGQQLQKANPVVKAAAAGSSATANGAASGHAAAGGPMMKAGSVLFAVLDTSINSDESSPIMATVVTGPLKGAKLLGQFKRVNQRLLLQFNLLNSPHSSHSVAINAVAIDPNTARTAISGQVNNHYLLKYGVVFGSAFLSGMSQAVMQPLQSGCGFFGCVKHDPLNTRQQVTVGLGTAGQRIADDASQQFANMPPTVKVKGGTGIGLLIMQDLALPGGGKGTASDARDHG